MREVHWTALIFTYAQTKTPPLFDRCLHLGQKEEGLLFALLADVRQQRHEPRLFDGRRELALMLCADMRVARIDHLCLARNEPAQKVDLFIVDIL